MRLKFCGSNECIIILSPSGTPSSYLFLLNIFMQMRLISCSADIMPIAVQNYWKPIAAACKHGYNLLFILPYILNTSWQASKNPVSMH